MAFARQIGPFYPVAALGGALFAVTGWVTFAVIGGISLFLAFYL